MFDEDPPTLTARRAIRMAVRWGGSFPLVSAPNSEDERVLKQWRNFAGLRRAPAAGFLLALALSLDPGIARATDSAVPDDLRVEYARAPLGLDTPAPRLAWQVPVTKQTAYRLKVATSREALARGELFWDSGKVASDANSRSPMRPDACSRNAIVASAGWDAAGNATGWTCPLGEHGLLAASDGRPKDFLGPNPHHDWVDLTRSQTDADGKSAMCGSGLFQRQELLRAYVWRWQTKRTDPS